MLLGEGAPLRNMLQPQSLFVLLTLLTEPCSSMNTPSLQRAAASVSLFIVVSDVFLHLWTVIVINSDFPEPPQKAVNADRRGD